MASKKTAKGELNDVPKLQGSNAWNKGPPCHKDASKVMPANESGGAPKALADSSRKSSAPACESRGDAPNSHNRDGQPSARPSLSGTSRADSSAITATHQARPPAVNAGSHTILEGLKQNLSGCNDEFKWYRLLIDANYPKEPMSLDMAFCFSVQSSGILHSYSDEELLYCAKKGEDKSVIAFYFKTGGQHLCVLRAKEGGEQLGTLKQLCETWGSIEHICGSFFLFTIVVDESNIPTKPLSEFETLYVALQDTLTVGRVFHQVVYPKAEKDAGVHRVEAGLKGLKTHFVLDRPLLQVTLRPVPKTLFELPILPPASLDTADNNPTYPWVFGGASGSGKTAAAVSMDLNDTVSRNFGDTFVVGLYIVYSRSEIGKRSFLQYVADKLIERCGLVRANDLRGTVFYIVMDEMGDAKKEAHEVLRNGGGDFTGGLQRAFGDRNYVNIDQCQFFYSVVGAGVTGPDEEGNSLPNTYIPIEPSMNQLFFLRVRERSKNNEPFAKSVEAAVNKHPNLQALLTNRRCEYVMANAICNLSASHSVFLVQSSATGNVENGKEDIETIADIVTKHSSFIETETTSGYMNYNGWASLKNKASRRCFAYGILSLLFTQPHGYHLLPPKDVWYLVVKLGAVEDTLRLEAIKEKSTPATPEKSPSFGFAPTDTQYCDKATSDVKFTPTTSKISVPHAKKPVPMRFIVPPASVIVALNILADTPHSGSNVSPTTYEKIVSSALLATLNAFTWYTEHKLALAAKDPQNLQDPKHNNEAAEFKVPLKHLFPNIEGDVANEELTLRVTQSSQLIWEPVKAEGLDRVKVSGNNRQMSSATSSAQSSGTRDSYRVNEVIKEVEAQIAERGAAFVEAGPGTPFSDITIITAKQCIGVELKNYTEGGLIHMDTLRIRCFQTGYSEVRLDTTSEVKMLKGHRPARILLPSLNPMLDNAERLDSGATADVLRCDEKSGKVQLGFHAKSGAISTFGRIFHMALRRPKEYLILCSPSSRLLPPNVSASFHGARSAELKNDVWVEQEHDGECPLSCVVLSTLHMLRCCHPEAKAPVKNSHAQTPTKENIVSPPKNGSQKEGLPNTSVKVPSEPIAELQRAYVQTKNTCPTAAAIDWKSFPEHRLRPSQSSYYEVDSQTVTHFYWAKID